MPFNLYGLIAYEKGHLSDKFKIFGLGAISARMGSQRVRPNLVTEQHSLSEHGKGLFTALASFRLWVSQVVLVVKNPPANAGDARDVGLFPGSGRSLGEGNGNPLQCSCLENPRDRGAWWVAVYGVAQSRT